MKKINPIVHWWVTPKLPYHDIYEMPLLISKSIFAKYWHIFSKWVIHPVKRRAARWYLRYLQKNTGIVVVGITGSAGKTTSKEMLFSILKRKDRTVRTRTFLDPVYNIPNTILATPIDTKYLILEMGVEYPGEMDFYLWLADPDIGVITNIYPTHTEFFKDVKGVLSEKSKLVYTLGANDGAVLNYESPLLRELAPDLKEKIIWYGEGSSIFAEKIKPEINFKTNFRLNLYNKKIEIELPTVGKQFVENALAASATAFLLGVDIKDIKHGLESYNPPEHRMKVIRLKMGAVLLDDSYNNNPEAAKSAISTLNEIAQNNKKVVVFGDMLELGKDEKDYHRNLGDDIANSGCDYLIAVGALAKYTAEEARKRLGRKSVYWLKNVYYVAPIIKRIIEKDMFVLIKGSRSIGLDKVVAELSGE
jgi:UDP-N-acetylmuramoyl-tripeptide--D-alanyl-D-alanine ligase